MLVREPLLPEQEKQSRTVDTHAFLHSALHSVKGFMRNPLRVSLPNNDPLMAGALAALLGVMLYVAALALLGHFVLSHAAASLDSGLSSAMTIEVAPADAAQKDMKPAPERAEDVKAKLRGLPGVKNITIIEEARVAQLLAPWLGTADGLKNLPLPLLLDVQLDARATIDKSAVQKALEGVAGVSVDDHGQFLVELKNFAGALRATAFYIVALSLLGLVLAAYFAAQAAYYINRDMIEILHLIGAEDSAIAGYTGMTILRLSLLASCVAFILSMLTLLVLSFAQKGMDFSFLPSLSFSFLDWVVLLLEWLLLLVGAIGACLIAARFTVLASLAKLP